jgi:hypothetical protein
VLAGILARTQGRSVVVAVGGGLVVPGSRLMLVGREPMVVLRVIVAGVGVNVQREALDRGRGHHQSEQDRHETMHGASVWDPSSTRQTEVGCRRSGRLLGVALELSSVSGDGALRSGVGSCRSSRYPGEVRE